MARILIVDDEASACEMIARICEFRGHETQTVRDGTRALALTQEFVPDLVITDLSMPLGGGLLLVQGLRVDPRTATVPVIVVTGYSALLDDAERAALDARAIIKKPVDVDVMLHTIDEALGLHVVEA